MDVARVAQTDTQTHFVDEKDGIAQGQQVTYNVTLNKPGKILANLVYTDAPASPNAASALVNDLDLAMTGPQAAAPHDRKNNHEMIEMSNLPAGTYTLTVSGVNVPQGKNGKQPFALVYTAREN
jgi:hypothetical protein